MKSFLIYVLILCFNPVALAEEEMDFLVGDWVTYDGSFRNDGIRISDNGDHTLNLKYCERFDLYAGECKQKFSYEGTIHFSAPFFVVNEGSSSPNPSYLIEKHEDGPDKFIRKWGNQDVVYRRINVD